MSASRWRRYLLITLAGVCLFSSGSFAQCTGISFTPSSFNFTSSGGVGSFTVTTSGNCPSLVATPTASWIGIISFVGTTVTFQVAQNPDLISRLAGIKVSSGGVSNSVPIAESANTGDFSLSASPATQTVPRGSTAIITVTVSRTNGFTGGVSLSTPQLPAGMTSSINGNTISVRTDPGMAVGPYNINIQGTNGLVSHIISVSLNVVSQCSVTCATMQTDGNFVLYNASGQPLWASNTVGTGAAIVRVQDDGNLVLYALTKQAGGVLAAPSPGPFPAQSCSIGTLLHAPEFMFSGQCITSPKGQYFLYMAPSDGNLFIYDLAQGHGVWNAPGTPGHPGDFLNFQPNSNLVVYNSTGSTVLWQTFTTNSGATLLNMEDDGRLLLYRPVWNTGTNTTWDTTQYPHPACDLGSGTGQTGAMAVGQCFVSPNGRYELFLDPSNHLMLLDNSKSPATVLWQRP